MLIKEITEDITTLNTAPKLGKLPHEEVESVIHQWVNQEDHIELSNGMHVLSGENHGYDDNVALIVDANYKILDHDDDIVELMQQFTAQEIDPSIVETIVEKCWKGYQKKGMKTMFGKRVPNCVKKEAVEDETIEERATIPVKGYTDAEEFISDFWFYGHNPSEMVSHIGPRSRPTWVFIKDPKHKELDKFLDDNDMYSSKLTYDELKVVLWLAKKMNISPMTVLRYGSDSIRFDTDTIKAVKQIVAKSKKAVEEDLRAWFGKGKKGGAGGGGWDRYNTKGERIGKCGDSKKGEGKPKCLSKSRAASLRAKGGKKAIAAAVRKKRREDPNKNRKGKAKNVSNTTRKTKK